MLLQRGHGSTLSGFFRVFSCELAASPCSFSVLSPFDFSVSPVSIPSGNKPSLLPFFPFFYFVLKIIITMKLKCETENHGAEISQETHGRPS